MVFHNDAFTASEVGMGLALGAVTGTLGRFASGALLDRGLRCSLPVLLAALLAMVADLLLLGAHQVGACWGASCCSGRLWGSIGRPWSWLCP
jgi:predicted MFS family arabinose efflux permease